MNLNVVTKHDEITYNFGYLSLIDENYSAEVNNRSSGKSYIYCLLYLRTVFKETKYLNKNKGAKILLEISLVTLLFWIGLFLVESQHILLAIYSTSYSYVSVKLNVVKNDYLT